MELDDHGQPKIEAYNWRQNFAKSVESLIGLCRGLLADGILTDDEIIFLDTWLKENAHILHEWPAHVIADRLRAVLADGVITEEERDDLKATLEEIIGGGIDEGIVDGLATRLPTVRINELEFDGRMFCLTGRFVYGPRRKCEQVIIDRNGAIHPRVAKSINYLVIGTLSSRDWAYTSHGRKIEKAVEYNNSGASIVIISEEDWNRFL